MKAKNYEMERKTIRKLMEKKLRRVRKFKGEKTKLNKHGGENLSKGWKSFKSENKNTGGEAII